MCLMIRLGNKCICGLLDLLISDMTCINNHPLTTLKIMYVSMYMYVYLGCAGVLCSVPFYMLYNCHVQVSMQCTVLYVV